VVSAGIPEFETVAGFAMTVAVVEPLEEAEGRWGQRVDALAQWLLAEWRCTQGAADGPRRAIHRHRTADNRL
jgi:hypothetical protein